MATATAVTSARGLQQMGSGLFSEMWAVRCTIDGAAAADGTGETHTLTVPGVALGDMVVGVSAAQDLLDMTVTGYVQGTDTVEIRVQNESGASLSNPASATYYVLVARPAW